MFRKVPLLIALSSLLASSAFSQGMQTRASKDDWEEINFEFNSSVLSDGYPSLLRLAELLNKNPGFRVKVEGHTDGIGSARFNEKLGQARANAVRDFLVKYGANANQITASTRGESDPEIPGEKRRYSKTDVARWMNRRVVLTVTDDQGRTISAGGVGDAIGSMEKLLKGIADAQQKCCDEILRRLDKLDDIAKMLQGMADQNAQLRKEVDTLKAAQDALANQVRALPKPLTEEQTNQVVDTRLERFRDPRFSLLGINLGADSDRHVTFSGKGRYFAPFKDHFAVQAQGEYLYFHDMREGQFDLGLVDRIGNFQAGMFSSFKHVNFRQYANGGTLGQASLTLDYITRLGRVGLFGAKGFMGDAVLNRTNWTFLSGYNPDGTARMSVAPNVFVETYMRVIDQVGVSAALGLWGRSYMEANLGYLRSRAHADRPGGTIKFVFPFADRLAFTVEGGMNETLLAPNNWGRAMVGLQFGNFTAPRDMQASKYAVPVDVPRVRYEVLTRTVRTGAAPPVADAGPDQIGVAAGTITLNGSNSYDPNGERLTYQWTQEGGPSVALSGANASTATFTAAQGQTYVFRLTVTNQSGLSSSARVRVTTQAPAEARIFGCNASHGALTAGQSAIITYQAQNATNVTVSPAVSGATLPLNGGTFTVTPTDTTVYTITVTGANNQTQSCSVPITVTQAQARVFGCFASPSSITAGGTTTVAYQAENATNVMVSPAVAGANLPLTGGTFSVSPTTNTTYTITVAGQNGQTSTCSVPVVVAAAGQTTITGCTVSPTNINAGEAATISFQTTNATAVTVNPAVPGVTVPAGGGSFPVSPTQTTTYTLTAAGANNQAPTCTVTVNVNGTSGMPRILNFAANPATITAGASSTLSWNVENATTVSIDNGVGTVSLTGSKAVSPTTTTTYTITATNASGSVTSTATVTVNPAAPTITSFTANPTSSPGPGSPVVLTCLANNATSVSIDNGAGALTNGSVTVHPQATTTYTCTATGTGGSATQTLTLNVAPGNPPVVVIGGAPTLTTFVRLVQLSATATSPINSALTYSWQYIPNGNQPASIQNPNSLTPTVYLGGTFGDYRFDLTVTDATGAQTTETIIVRLVQVSAY